MDVQRIQFKLKDSKGIEWKITIDLKKNKMIDEFFKDGLRRYNGDVNMVKKHMTVDLFNYGIFKNDNFPSEIGHYRRKRQEIVRKSLDVILYKTRYFDRNVLGIIKEYVCYEQEPGYWELIKLQLQNLLY
jgi:hypothetical protein